MKAVALFLVLFGLIQFGRCDKILSDFIRDYYEAYNIHQIVIFACWDYAVDISRSVMSLDTVVTYQSTTNDVDLKTILPVKHFQVGVVLDFDCPFSGNILDKFSNHLRFNDSYYWLVLSKLTPIPVKYFELLRLTIETELTFAIRDNDRYKLYEIYNPSYRHGCDVVTIVKGEWTPAEGLKDILTQYKYVRRDLQKLTLNLSVTFANPVTTDPLTYLLSTKNKGLDPMQKSHYQIMLLLQYMYKFRSEIYRSPLWGVLVNGSYNGMLGDIIGDTGVDMSLSPFLFISGRHSFLVEHLVPTWYFDFTFTFLHPKTSTLRNNFLKPFTDDLWWAILLVGIVYWSLLLLSLMLEQCHRSGTLDVNSGVVETGLTTVAALSQQENGCPVENTGETKIIKWCTCHNLFFQSNLISSMLKGLSDSPNFSSGRITFLSLFLWALLLYQFYSASIVSSLMTTPPRWIETLKDLSESDLEVGAINVSFFWDYFRNPTNPDIIEIYNSKMDSSVKARPNAFLSIPRGMKAIQQGGYAFFTETASTYRIIKETFTEDQVCAVQEIRAQRRTQMSPILPKGSPFKKMMTYGLTKIIQGGLLLHVRKDWRGSIPQCPEGYTSKPAAMGMLEFSPALFLLCIGAGVSIAILILEYLCFYLGNTSGTRSIHSMTFQSTNSSHNNFIPEK